MKKANNNKKLIIEYCNIVGDLLALDIVKSMKKYNHHGRINTHFHSVYVSFTAYRVCKAIGIEAYDIVRASLLHDFYLYDWHTDKHEEKHAWYHPKKAVENIENYIGRITPMQRDMILRHMWPLILSPPNSLGGYILTFSDKYCANNDLLGFSKMFLPIYNEILKIAEV